jgi:hypothetical protein
MPEFLSLRNFILAISAALGVILFVMTMMRWIGTASDKGGKKYTVGQLMMMFFISMVMVSSVTYMDMGSYTVFGSDSYTVAASDPWLVQGNIANIIAQLNLGTDDVDMLARSVTMGFMGLKAFGLALFLYTTMAWFRISSGESSSKGFGGIAFFYALAFCFWNFGIVVRMVFSQMGYEINI